MKSSMIRTMVLFLCIGFICSACTGDSQSSQNTPPPGEGSAIVQTDGSGLTESIEKSIDAAYSTFLADMVVYNTLDPDVLNVMLSEEPPPFLLDVRSVAEVEMNGRIQGAVVIPLRDVGKHTDQLPSFDTTIVSYCGSGWRCTIAMTALEALGWQYVLSLKGYSYYGWVEAGYPIVGGIPEAVPLNAAQPDAALLAHIDATLSSIPEGRGAITAETLNTEIIENPQIILVDVRRQEELEDIGMIEGAINIPLESFISTKADWPADKDATIVVYCGSDHRSTIAMTILWSYGYSDVSSLYGGVYGWLDAGYSVVQYAMQ